MCIVHKYLYEKELCTMKTGFIYQWTNVKNNMRYIGSHFGNVNDGYISSSDYFNEEYVKDPSRFVRKILLSGLGRAEALEKEQAMLIDLDAARSPEFYNLHNHSGKGWSHHSDPELAKIYYSRISKGRKGQPAKNKGIAMSLEQKKKLTDKWLVIDSKGKEFVIDNMQEFCLKNELNPSAMSRVARGIVRQHKGFFCKKLTNNRKVDYEYKKWSSKGKPGKAHYGGANGYSKKVKINNIVYTSMREASEDTGLSLHLIRKKGDFNV